MEANERASGQAKAVGLVGFTFRTTLKIAPNSHQVADIKIIFLWSGRYTVNVKYGDKHVPNSPFRVRAGPPFDASKVKVSGPGVDESPLTDEPVQFLCDCTEAGIAPLTGTRFL